MGKIINKITKHPWRKGNLTEWEHQRAEMEGAGLEFDHVRVGASDVSVIMKTNPWKEPQRLFRHLTGEYSNFQLTETTVSGHLLEPLIVARWESWDADSRTALMNTHNGFKVRNLSKAEFFLTNTDYPNQFISLDYIPDGEQYSPFTGELYDELTPHELKHTNYNYYRLWQGGITKAYYDQIQSQMALTNTQLAVFHVLVDGVKYNVQEIPRDEKRIQEIKVEVEKFCDKVRDGKAAYYLMVHGETEEERERAAAIYEMIMPPLVGSDDAVKLADELWEAPVMDKDAGYKKATKVEEALMDEYYGFLRLEEQLKKNKQRVQGTLKLKASKWHGIRGEGYKCTSRSGSETTKAYFAVVPLKKVDEPF